VTTRPHLAYVLATTAGGTGAHVAMLARGCAQHGLRVTVFGPSAAGSQFFQAAGGVAVGAGAAVPSPRFVPVAIAARPQPVRDLASVLRLRRLLARLAPGVVHAHGLRAGAFAALALTGRRHRPALAVTVHNSLPQRAGAALVYGVLARFVARRADAVVCVSADLSARMRRLGARDGGVAVVAAPGRPEPTAAEVAGARREMGAGDRPVVLAVGRLAAQKGFGTLIDAAATWRGRRPLPRVVIAGSGPQEPALRDRARAAGLDVLFLGQRGDVPALLAAADVVAVPSTWEGQPLLVAEALRAGRPIVASRVGGIPALTGDNAALLVPAGDVGSLTRAILGILDAPDVAVRLAAAARERAARLPGEDAAVAAALALYERLSAPTGSRS
jgi:glycosyltransferase involved in cell wall biosynthesis